jgi:hypothetical protein
MVIESTFQKSNRDIKNLNIEWTMDYWILITISLTPYKTYEHGFLSNNVISPRPIHDWHFEKKKKVIKKKITLVSTNNNYTRKI